MKHILIFSLVLMTCSAAYSQRKSNVDPTWSAHNYKHVNKAEFAKRNSTDGIVSLANAEAVDNSNYKHQTGKKKLTRKATISSFRGQNPAASHKRPWG